MVAAPAVSKNDPTDALTRRPERLAMVKSGLVSNEIFTAGRKRLKTLDQLRR
jgi:hypothetical protein